MSEYYTNAYFTIVAGSASDCAHGFLNNRSKPLAVPCDIVHSQSKLLRHAGKTELVMLHMPRSGQIGAIQTRAWTFQEEKLSQRSLVFGVEQLRFICETHTVFEDGNVERVSKTYGFNSTGGQNIHDLISNKDMAAREAAVFRLWRNGLYNYTGRRLSDLQDKLAAIAGYAKLFAKVTRCKYMYGLWEDDLLFRLLWKSHRPWQSSTFKPANIRELWRAPSWSWASITVPLLSSISPPMQEKFKGPDKMRLQILSYDSVPNAFDPVPRTTLSGTKAKPTPPVVTEPFELSVHGALKKVWHMPHIPSGFLEFKLFEHGAPLDIGGIVEL